MLQRLSCFPVQVKCDDITEALSVLGLQADILHLENRNMSVAEMVNSIAESPRIEEVLPDRTRF